MLSSRKSYIVISLIAVVATGCGDSNTSSTAPSLPTATGADAKPIAAGVTEQPAGDGFGVPASFHASYTLKQDEDISMADRTRRNVRIVVPIGLSDSEVENNMRVAAEKAYSSDNSPHAITVFAYKPGTPTDMEYTAGRLIWAPHGDWMQADQDVPIEEHKASVDISDEYHPKPKSTTPKSKADKELDAGLAKIDSDEKKREARLNRRISESRRHSIYYDVQTALNNGMSNPSR